MADEAIQTVAEILANLEEYRTQRDAIEELLRVEPYNAEYLEMAKSLDEVSTRRAGQIPADATSRSHSIHLPLGANPISDCTLSRLGARSEEF
eukprot:5645545-Pyramimonas_sp.AAC.2